MVKINNLFLLSMMTILVITVVLTQVSSSTFYLGTAFAAPVPDVGNPPTCPSLSGREVSNLVSVSTTTSGNTITYKFSSADESSSNGVPGLIDYCIYTGGTNPTSTTAIAHGADGSLFDTGISAQHNFFGYGRSGGNPTNLPLDGTQNVVIGTANFSTLPTSSQTILLHINDRAECESLYPGTTSDTATTCFVLPGTISQHLIVKKLAFDLFGDPDTSTLFTITASGTGSIDTSQIQITGGSSHDYSVTPGTYSISEDNPDGVWDEDVSQCQNVVVPTGHTVECTITNTQLRLPPPPTQDLTVSKTATPDFTRTYAWTISKNVDKSEIDIAEGGTATFTYTVTAAQNGAPTDSDWQVTGQITVSNPNTFDISGVTVTDAIDNGGTCTVTDGTDVTIPASDSKTFDYTCTYSSAPSSSDGTNTGTATWDKDTSHTPSDSASGTVSVNFDTPTTIKDGTITVDDSLGGSLGTVSYTDSSPKDFSYSHDFVGDTAGTCTTHDNTATFVTDTTQTTSSDKKTVEVCVGKDLTVSKTATPDFTRTYAWTDSKTVDKTLVEQIGGGTATFTYTVTAAQNGAPTDSDWQATGQITVSNPNDWEDVAVNVSDAIDNGGTCTVTDGTDVTIPASDSKTFDYTCTYSSAPSSSDGTNTGTATWDKDTSHTPSDSASGTVSVNFDTPTKTVDKTVTITDNFNSIITTLGTLTGLDTSPFASGTYTDPHVVNVPTFDCVKYDNTATIVETGQTSTKTVEVCGPAKTGALTIGFWQNKNGQNIITTQASTGVCPSTTWLRNYAPFQDLSTTSTCAQVGTYVTNIIKAANAGGASMNAMLKAQMLSTALDTYFSDSSLGGNKIGASSPLGGITIDLTNIKSQNASPAFGGATSMTVNQILSYAASQSNAGGITWYAQVKATQGLAKDTFDAINNQIAFSP